MSTSAAPNRVEHWVLLAFGGLIVLAVVVLVLRNRPLDPSLITPLRFLLALSAGMIGGLAPGALFKLDYRGRGLAVRSAGAAALFAAVWFGGPQLLPTLLATAAPDAAQLSAAPAS